MDLALLVYGISLLHGIGTFVVMCMLASGALAFVFFLWRVSECEERSYYSDAENKKRVENGMMCEKWIKRGLVSLFLFGLFLVFIPTEKTAYTMVGAYAAQKVAENDKVQKMSGKVLTIIEQKLDGYIDEGIKEAEDKVERATKNKSR
jgi:hypothetical protein